MSAPRLTVVIPTMGKRPDRLRAALEAIAEQALPSGDVEVVLGCDPGAEVPPAPPGLDVRAVHADSPTSAAAKRNLAWPLSRAPVVAFTDDDCRPAPGWAAALIEAVGRAPGAFVQGRTLPDPDESREHWGLAHTQTIARDSPWHETCNIAYPKELLERLGGFDEGYGLLGGEDTDLGLRAIEAGASKLYDEQALIWHAVEQRTFRQALREAARVRDQPQVIARFPGLRRSLYLGLFVRHEHGRLVLALLGLLSRRPLLALLAAAPYLEWHLRHYRKSPLSLVRAAVHLPVRVLVSATEMAVVAWRGLRRGVIAL